MKRIYALTLGFLLLIMVTSCNKTDISDDGLRIVVLSPELAEIIASLEATELMVGVTKECDYPPELTKLPQVGNFGAVDLEKVLALKPDMVFTAGLEQEALAAELAKTGLQVHTIHLSKLDELPQTILEIGKLIQRKKQASAVADSLRKGIAEMRNTSMGQAKPKVYLEIYRDPLMSVSDDSYVGELIETAGGDNIFSVLERDYARIKAEDVVKAKPDIMICYSEDSLESILSRKGWQDIPAIREKRIYFEKDIDPDLILRATPRALEGLRRLNKLFFSTD
ncbi:MAG: cobalamin-binding protein [Candidatus Cloacimonetes bacterium]|mgnify:CR=1 FL=1|nr:cobalamin-binding protein [Candidatus Cloacimonadota bacterium]